MTKGPYPACAKCSPVSSCGCRGPFSPPPCCVRSSAGRSAPPDRWRHTLRHLLVGIAFGVAYLTLIVAVEPWLPMQGEPSGRPIAQRLLQTLTSGILPCLMIYGLLVAAGHGVALRRRFRRARARTEALRTHSAQLERQLAQAQLRALRSQLQPHFLFNTLNAVSALIDNDPEQARTMIVRLSDLLRAALDQDRRLDVPLAEEIEMLERYLDIERVRFGHRLRVDYQVREAALSVTVPSLLLQPLVENAVRHGIAPLARPGVIEIEADVHGDLLVLFVRDDGCGFGADDETGGIGLANTRSRLAQSFGPRARMTIETRAPSGTEVRIELPVPVAQGDPRADASDPRTPTRAEVRT